MTSERRQVGDTAVVIADRLAEVRQRVAEAAARADRDPTAVKVVGVTKGVAAGLVKGAAAAGLVDLGENRIQEWLPKARLVGGGVRWHFVGRLQSNKVRYLNHGIQMVHSLDRSSLLAALVDRWSAWAEALAEAEPSWAGPAAPGVFVQVNVAGEEGKAGIKPAGLESFLGRVQDAGIRRVEGLMTIAPFTAQPESVRWVFARLRELRDRARQRFGELGLGHLSMGMTGDYEVAIEEGATIVRLGTAIFGSRGRGA